MRQSDNREQPLDDIADRPAPPSRKRRRIAFFAAAVALPLPLVATLFLAPWAAEQVTAANFRAIRIGMSQSELEKLLGPSRFDSHELGLVTGPTTYTANLGQNEKELRARGFQEWLRQVWVSPEITITAIVDAERCVVCAYSSAGQARDLRGLLRMTTTERLRTGGPEGRKSEQ